MIHSFPVLFIRVFSCISPCHSIHRISFPFHPLPRDRTYGQRRRGDGTNGVTFRLTGSRKWLPSDHPLPLSIAAFWPASLTSLPTRSTLPIISSLLSPARSFVKAANLSCNPLVVHSRILLGKGQTGRQPNRRTDKQTATIIIITIGGSFGGYKESWILGDRSKKCD